MTSQDCQSMSYFILFYVICTTTSGQLVRMLNEAYARPDWLFLPLLQTQWVFLSKPVDNTVFTFTIKDKYVPGPNTIHTISM